MAAACVIRHCCRPTHLDTSLLQVNNMPGWVLGKNLGNCLKVCGILNRLLTTCS
jgi:hypothetical protein